MNTQNPRHYIYQFLRQTAVKRLKNGKACGEDNIINEMIRAFSEDHLHLLTQIFNVVLLNGHIPNGWLISIMKLIYKSDINYPDNYRGITLLSCLVKLFTSIINERLTAFINSKQIMSVLLNYFVCQGRRLFCTRVDL